MRRVRASQNVGCPKYGSSDVVPITYALPTRETALNRLPRREEWRRRHRSVLPRRGALRAASAGRFPNSEPLRRAR